MSKTFNVNIITPTKIIYEKDVEYLRAPSYDGLFGVKIGHVNSIIGLNIGEIKIIQNGKEKFYSSSTGYADITDKQVEILVESIEGSNQIDETRAKSSVGRSKKRLKDNSMNQNRAFVSLEKALNRLKVSKR